MKLYKLFGLLTILISFSFGNAYSQMFWNQAAQFAGTSSSYIRVSNSSSVNLTGSFTLEAWVNPNSTLTSKGIIGKGGTLGTAMNYGLRLTTAGRVQLITNGTPRLLSKSVSNVPIGQWTHICGTYNSTTNIFRIYINGILDTSSTIAGAAPASNTDSLFIGITGATTPFNGRMDEVRIWNRDLTTAEQIRFFRTSIASSSGKYSGLVLTMTFQQNENNGPVFSTADWSVFGNGGFGRNITAVDLGNRPSETIALNDCMELDGTDDYASAPDNASISPTTQLTMSAWIYPRAYANSIIIHKGSPSGGASTNYRLAFFQRTLFAGINGNFYFMNTDTIPLNQWTHVAFAYHAATGAYYFYINGNLKMLGSAAPAAIVDGTDSLYIGGTPNLTKFNGLIDEVKIINDVKFEETIAQSMYRPSEESLGEANACWNLDGYAYCNYDLGPTLQFRNDAGFAHIGATNNQGTSPMVRSDNSNFQSGFLLKTSDRRIPETGDVGSMKTDSLIVLSGATINDIDLFVALNHTYESDLTILLTGPNGAQTIVCQSYSLASGAENFETIFDDDSPDSLISGKIVQLGPRVKPKNSLNTDFAGSNSAGVWRLSIIDVAALDTGRLFSWGLRFNNASGKQYVVRSRQFTEGFYRTSANTTVQDTLKYYLRNTASPFLKVDSARTVMNSQGYASFIPGNVSAGAFYFLSVEHRNSIETWSNVLKLDALTFQLDYDFTLSSGRAYGSNMTLIDTSPATRYGFYSGDVNQSQDVDATDLARIDNDAINFAGGYIPTDVNGDGFTDATDYAIADNNATNFIGAVLPGPEPIIPVPFSNEIEADKIFNDPSIANENVGSFIFKYTDEALKRK